MVSYSHFFRRLSLSQTETFMTDFIITEPNVTRKECSLQIAEHFTRLRSTNWVPLLLMTLTVVSFGLRFIWLDKPDGALIFDESYYVNAARIILGIPVASEEPYAGSQPELDPNTEHPPLGKLLISGSMYLLGDNGLGWRLPSVLFGTLTIPVLFGIVRRTGGTARLALLTTFIYSFDNLTLVHSRIATLDVFMVAFILLGIYGYVCEKPTLAGLAFVAATLCKIGGLYGVAAVMGWEGLRFIRTRWETGRWHLRHLRLLAIMSVVYVATLPVALGFLDSLWSSYKHPVAHMQHILQYGLSLSRPEGPQGDESNPWQWLVNDVQMTYLRTDVEVIAGNEVQTTRASIFFRGAMNPYVVMLAPMAMAYAAYLARTRRDNLSFMALMLFAATYGPYWPAALLAHRISYIFYFLPTIPAVAIGTALLMYHPQMPRIVRWAYIGAILLGFCAYFPFRIIP